MWSVAQTVDYGTARPCRCDVTAAGGSYCLNPPVEKSKAIRGTRDEFRDAMRQLAKDHVLALLTAHPDTWELADVPAGCAAVRPFRPDGRGRAGGGN
jgi:hypothetical protein